MPVSIEIFGVRGYIYDVLKTLLQDALAKARIDYVIKDVQKIDDFISEGIEGVPTVRVNHKKSFTKTEETTSQEIVNAIIAYILSNDVQSIICPIDFSAESIHAASWALHLSKLMHKQLDLVHVYKPVMEISYPMIPETGTRVHALDTELHAVSEEIADGLLPIPNVKVETGDPLQVLVRKSQEPSASMIVMGTQGAARLTGRLFGSISSSVARHASVPVLLIPPKVQYKRPRHIMIAFHEQLLSNGTLNKLIDFNNGLQAHMQFVHVRDYQDSSLQISEDLMERLTRITTPGFSFDIQEIPSDSQPVLQVLLNYAEQMQPDIIVFVTRHRNMIRRIISPGLTRKMETQMHWPLLIMRAG